MSTQFLHYPAAISSISVGVTTILGANPYQVLYTATNDTLAAGDSFKFDPSLGVSTTLPLMLGQVATPANPASGSNKLYFKSDNNLYQLTSAGVETQVGGGGGMAIGGAIAGASNTLGILQDNGSGLLAESPVLLDTTTANIVNMTVGADRILNVGTLAFGAGPGNTSTMLGFQSGLNVTAGIRDVFLGRGAGANAGNNNGRVAVGYNAGADTMGFGAIVVGAKYDVSSQPMGDYSIILGAEGMLDGGAGAANELGIGSSAVPDGMFITGTPTYLSLKRNILNVGTSGKLLSIDAATTDHLHGTLNGEQIFHLTSVDNRSVAFGYHAGLLAANDNGGTFFGTEAGSGVNGATRDTFIGTQAGRNAGTGGYRVAVGRQAGDAAMGGATVIVGSRYALGPVAVGDHCIVLGSDATLDGGPGASSELVIGNPNATGGQFITGTSAYLNIKRPIKSDAAQESTGAGTALLGTNSPATTLSAPYTWITMITSDGSTVYMPVWK